MYNLLYGVGLACLVCVMVVAVGVADDKADTDKQDIVDTAVSAGNFKTLATALAAADLIETLKGEGPFTFFAPTDEAFEEMSEATLDELLMPENKDKLVEILTYHVVPGKLMAGDLADKSSLKTVEGSDVNLSSADGNLFVDEAFVTEADIECENGVIHVIDAVIMPDD